MIKLTKRLAKLIYWLDSSPILDIGSRAVRYELSLFTDLNDISKDTICITYSNTELRDVTRALNWLLEFRDSGPMDGLSEETLDRHSDDWRTRYNTYRDHWDAAHEDEIAAWNQQPEQVARNGLSEFVETLGRQGDGPKETQFDKLRAWADKQAAGGFISLNDRQNLLRAMQGRPVYGSVGASFSTHISAPISVSAPSVSASTRLSEEQRATFGSWSGEADDE